MNYEEAYSKTIENGGYSEKPGKYMVAFSGYERVIPAQIFTRIDLIDYKDFIGDLPLGTWYNEEDGNIYLDVSVGVDNRSDAIKLGIKYNQIAIYDIVNDKEIIIDYNNLEKYYE